MNSKYDQLHPDLQRIYTEAKASYIEDHPGDVFLPQLDATYRPNAVQTAYYAQGRLPLPEINKLRAAAGIYLIGEKEAKTKITNAKAGQSPHNFLPSRALDVIFTKDGKASWDTALYKTFGSYMLKAATKLGVEVSYGGNWKSFPDFPHTELLHWKTM